MVRNKGGGVAAGNKFHFRYAFKLGVKELLEATPPSIPAASGKALTQLQRKAFIRFTRAFGTHYRCYSYTEP